MSEKKEKPLPIILLSLWCCRPVEDLGWEGTVCVCDGQSDRHQAGGEHKVDGPRQADGWVPRQMDPGQWADKMMGSDELDRFR